MMKKINFLITSLVFIFVSSVFAQGESLNDIVAYVNDQVITQTELNNQVNIIKQQYIEQHMAVPPEKTLAKQVLEHLIDAKLQLQKAKEVGITVDEKTLNDALKRIAQANHLTPEQMKQTILRQGVNFDTYRNNIREQIILSRVQQAAVGRSITINKAAVLKLLDQQGDNKLKLYKIEDILIPVADINDKSQAQAAEKLAQHLVSDKASLAAALKNQANIQSNDLGWRSITDLPEVFANKVAHMQSGQISDPIKAGNGYHILKVIAVKSKNKPGSLTYQQAEKMVYAKKFEEAVVKWVKSLRSVSYVKIDLK